MSVLHRHACNTLLSILSGSAQACCACRLAGRELQKWTPEASDDTSGMLLESEPHGKSSRWDQFAANQQLFGTDTSYNEDLYTTKLDASVSGITVEEAERLAAEIQRGVTSNRHMAEERGGGIDDSGVSIAAKHRHV